MSRQLLCCLLRSTEFSSTSPLMFGGRLWPRKGSTDPLAIGFDPKTRKAGDEKGLFVGHQQSWSSIDRPPRRHLVILKQRIRRWAISTAAEADGSCRRLQPRCFLLGIKNQEVESCQMLAVSCSATAKAMHCVSFNCHAEMPRIATEQRGQQVKQGKDFILVLGSSSRRVVR